ncbi:exopolysaccharide biosynthesis protein [Scytonema hofmannii PCC 7110]|uniref:Exopolysaccharide biosynthesis protein n=1 Tax=Scytonema hofmannii PCC 7110 TaxID=128403 RepID=A0A139WSU3_9CYAN|nr:tyrosine-protein kinase domain-containing protein [Scytonema hofmannii]KYC35501.1 exopolysaccharide biosynthesis protein [Scytonema hofmannii PCC 7110]
MNKLVTISTKHWKSLIAFNVLVVLATAVAVSNAKPVWIAKTQLILPKTTSNLDANLGTLGSLRNGDSAFSSEVNPLNVQASILTSDTLLEKVLASDPERGKFNSISRYRQLFKVTPQEQSTIMLLTVSGSSPKLANQRAIAITEAYQNRLNELRQANSRTRQKFSQIELEQAKLKLAQAQSKLTIFKQSSGLINNEDQAKGIVDSISTLTTVRAQVLATAEASENRAKALSIRLSLTPNEAIRSLGLGENKEYQFVRQQLSEVEASLRQKQAIFTDVHPEVKTLLAQRESLQRKIQEHIRQTSAGTKVDTTVATDSQGRAALIQQQVLAESEATAQRRQAQQLNNQITQLQTTLKSFPVNQARLVELQRQVDVTEGVYKGLIAQIQQSNIDAFDAYPNIQVLDAPQVDPKPVSPKFLLMAVNALLASIIGSIALVLFLESRNPLLNLKDLQGQKFAIVQSIPRIKHSDPKIEMTSVSEVEFQRLASAISLQPLNNRRLLVTSATQGEGKTTVAIGLAYGLVDLGFRVLLVDGDFRSAELSRSLGYAEDSTIEQLQRSIQPNLDLLPTLPKRGKIVETIKRGRFEQALTACEARGNYDYVIVDSAPVSLTSETALMATLISNVLFVVRPDSSYKNSVNESFAQLSQHNVEILGLVVNAVESKKKPYSYHSDSSLVNT